MQLFIDAIELYPEKMDDGRIIRQIDLAFPVYYEGFEGEVIRLLNENTVETVYLLSFSIEKCSTHQKRFQLRTELKPF